MATTPIQYPFINGVRHSFASVEFKFNGQIFTGIKAINYKRTRNRELVRGNHPDPMGKTEGENEYEADAELYLAEWNQFQVDVLKGKGYGDILFPVNVTYSAGGFDTISDIIIGCSMDSTEAALQQGPAPLTRKFNLSPLKILFGSVDDLAVPLAGVQT